jgi:V/A-type H+-transporting ATPase subunit A
MAVLAAADRLEAIVQLVGASALPDRERAVLLAARLIRQAVLQQNALSPNDASCGLAKQAALLDLVLAIYERSLVLIDAGVPVSLLEEVDLSDAVRVRERVGPTNAAGIDAVRDELLARLGKVQ